MFTGYLSTEQDQVTKKLELPTTQIFCIEGRRVFDLTDVSLFSEQGFWILMAACGNMQGWMNSDKI